MATLTYIPEHSQHLGAMKRVIDYCLQEQKVYDSESERRLVGGVYCDGENAYAEFVATKTVHRKTDGMNYYQYVQSFSPQEDVSPAQVHAIGLEFAAKAWSGHEVLVTTHCDTSHWHNHFIINSVAFESGYKLRQHPNTLYDLRALNDAVCEAHGLSTLKTYQGGGEKMSSREYRAAAKGDSWKFKLMAEIDDAMAHCGTREAFIKRMKKRGYKVTWTPERKYITYTCPSGYKCRDIRLHDAKYEKANMDAEFDVRAGVTDDTRVTGWEDTRGVYTEVTFEEPQEIAPPVDVGTVTAGALGATAGMMQGDTDDPEEQKRRQEAKDTAAAIGMVAGVAIGAMMTSTPDENYDDDDMDEDVDEGFGFTMSMM